MRNQERRQHTGSDKDNIRNFYVNMNRNFTHVLAGVITRTHLLMLSTFTYAQKVRMFGTNKIFDSLCRHYYILSNTVQQLIGNLNENGVETSNIYGNLARLSEISHPDEDDDSFSEGLLLNTLIGLHQNIIAFIHDNFDITSFKMNSELCSIIVDRLNEHRKMIKDLNRLKTELEENLVFKGQLN